MKYINTKHDQGENPVSFRQAAINGLAKGGGLYMPEHIPSLPQEIIEALGSLNKLELAYEIMSRLVGDSLGEVELKRILTETLAFDIPVKRIHGNINVLELFHGPTLAFKDVGARFMSRCLGAFRTEDKVHVLVATSGDTGSAVAHGFHGVEGVEVTILFPKGKVSAFQEYQMSSLGDNIEAIEIDGAFDDCQSLVKQAFQDAALNNEMSLSSANSINVARLLPQSLYYAMAYQQMLAEGKADKIAISVPSGNYGNITAGMIAMKMGIPIHRFIAANNANDAVYRYMQSGLYEPKKTVSTYSNAMDVGAPNNFDRILHLYNHDYDMLQQCLSAYRYSDEETIQKMKQYQAEYNYLLDPHGAVGVMALEDSLKEDEHGIFLATAHPKKFEKAVKLAVPTFEMDEVDLSNCHKVVMDKDYAQFKSHLLAKC